MRVLSVDKLASPSVHELEAVVLESLTLPPSVEWPYSVDASLWRSNTPGMTPGPH